jgi:lipoate-protein ligase A
MFRIIFSRCMDPYINLAAEDRMFRSLNDGERVLFLWRNRDAVIMGRYQNPYQECSLPELRKDGILLVRRQSGGGTVFHDPGNTNFTFITSRNEYDKGGNTQLVSKALKESFDIDAYPSGRNDILVDGKKISGSAFKLTTGKAFHHGTLLVNADLEKLSRYLKPEEKMMEAKGIRSIRSEVANLSSYCSIIDHEKICEALRAAAADEWGGEIDMAELDEKELLLMKGCAEKVEELKSWEWIFGKTPPFTVSFAKIFPAGPSAVRCRVIDGRFGEVEIQIKGFSEETIKRFCSSLKGKPCIPEEIRKTGKEVKEAGLIFEWLAAEF